MKKALLVLLIIVCLGFLVANQGIIVEFIDTVQGGALIPLIVAVILMLALPYCAGAFLSGSF